MRVVIDTNVLIDAIAERNDYQSAQAIIMAVAEDRIVGMISASSITDVHYILKKRIGDSKARLAVMNLLAVFDVAEINAEMCATALSVPMQDYEDAVLAVCAKEYGAEYIVSGDKKLIAERNCPIPVLTVQEMLKNL